ncbi:MAG: hypothetical protein M3P27_07670 [Acidobacteriota bacterium]|nr:hypothetical protein [Acidobacteriota bacterium]
MQLKRFKLHLTMLLLLMALAAPLTAQENNKDKDAANPANLPELIWRDPGDVASLNLLYGAGGAGHAPKADTKYKFVKEDMAGSNPKFDVVDAQGVHWKVKLGEEAPAEVAASRLLWAAGYFVDEDYYLAELKVSDVPELHRGSTSGGKFKRARLERKLTDVKKDGNWKWSANPFLSQQEFGGLRAMMALLNNWDLKDSNNTIQVVNLTERRYALTDLGATFGKTGGVVSRSKSNPKDYAKSRFIEKAGPDFVDFALRARGDMEKVTTHVPRADAKWLGQRLSQLTGEQIRDCFRAAGYKDEEVTMYAQTVQKRIAELAAL